MIKDCTLLFFATVLIVSYQTKDKIDTDQVPFPCLVSDVDVNRRFSIAMQRSFHTYPSPRLSENERYSQFKYTKLKGLDNSGGDGIITRPCPIQSKSILSTMASSFQGAMDWCLLKKKLQLQNYYRCWRSVRKQ